MRLLTLRSQTWYVDNRLQQLLSQFVKIRNLENVFFFTHGDLFQLIFEGLLTDSYCDDFDTFRLCRRKLFNSQST